MNYRVNVIYSAFMGEVNKYGIGVPCTFLRLAGCNLRCYKKTMGILCDTPEALEMDSGTEFSIEEIISALDLQGNKVICLTGGEPLLHNTKELLEALSLAGYLIVVETNGSILVRNFQSVQNVSFIVDFKGSSTGEQVSFKYDNLKRIRKGEDFLKFVIADERDYEEMRFILESNPEITTAAAGIFWGTDKITYQDLVRKITEDKLGVYLNTQTHKLMVMYDHHKGNVSEISIPKEL